MKPSMMIYSTHVEYISLWFLCIFTLSLRSEWLPDWLSKAYCISNSVVNHNISHLQTLCLYLLPASCIFNPSCSHFPSQQMWSCLFHLKMAASEPNYFLNWAIFLQTPDFLHHLYVCSNLWPVHPTAKWVDPLECPQTSQIKHSPMPLNPLCCHDPLMMVYICIYHTIQLGD